MHTLFVLRHGETEWNLAGRMQGTLDSPLTARGRIQAARQGAILRNLGFVGPTVSSPARRARTTAALAGLRAQTDPRLSEISMGAWQGLTREQVTPRPGVLWKFDAPGAETVLSLTARLRSFLASLDGPTVVVTHGVVCIVLQALSTGRAVPDWDGIDDPQGVVLRLEAGSATLLG